MAVLLDGGFLRMDTSRPDEPGERPPDLLQGPRVAALLRGAQGGGDHRRRRAAHVPQARQPARGPSDAAHPADRRRHRLARPGPADRGRRRAGGQAARPAPVPRLVPVRRLRDGRGLDLGGVRARGASTGSTTSPRSSTSTGSARRARRWSAGTSTATRPAPRRSAGTRSRSTATTSRRSTPRTTRRSPPPGRPTVIVARTKKGSGVKAVEDQPGKHGKPLDDPDAAIAELGGERDLQVTLAAPDERHAAPVRGARRRAAHLGRRRAGGHAQGLRRGADGARRRSAATSSRSTARCRTRRTPSCSARRTRTATSRCSSPSSRWSPRRSGCRCAAGCRSPRRSPRSSRAPTTSSAWRRSRARTSASRGSHAGVSIGEDGPSQMALEDIAAFRAIHGSTVLHPSDANQTAQLVAAMADREGISFLRTLRGKTTVRTPAGEDVPIGGSRVAARRATTSRSWPAASRSTRRSRRPRRSPATASPRA